MPCYLQINANRSRPAMDLAWATAAEHNVELLLVSEPNRASLRSNRWYKDPRQDAAIGYTGPRSPVNAVGGGDGFVWVQVKGVAIYSCYVSPNIPLEDFEIYVNYLSANIAANNSDGCIVTGDFNAKSPLWGSLVTDPRANILGDMLSSLGLVALNQWGVYRFVRRGGGTTVDITAVSENRMAGRTRWRVIDDKASLNPHLDILFGIGPDGAQRQRDRWVQGPIHKETLAQELMARGRAGTPTAESLAGILKGAYAKAARRVRTTDGRMPYWWTTDIAALRAATVGRRICTRMRRRRITPEPEIGRADETTEGPKRNCGQLSLDRKRAHGSN